MMYSRITLVGASLLCLGSYTLFGQTNELKKHELYWTYNDVRASLEDWAAAFNEPSGKLIRRYIAKKGYKSVLDIPCGGCPEYFGYKNENTAIDYVGMDYYSTLSRFCIRERYKCQAGLYRSYSLR